MPHFQMCNISNFVQISSRSAYWRKDQQLLLGYYCQVVLEKGLLSDIRAKCRHQSQMDTWAGRRTNAHGLLFNYSICCYSIN